MVRRSIILLIIFPLWVSLTNAQSGTWTWVKGDNYANSGATLGTIGVANESNTPPGLYESPCWIDHEGNFWLFGGVFWQGLTSDLWKYNPTTNMWTWVKGTGLTNQPGAYSTQGVPSVANNPAARGYASHAWTDNIGDLWLFGGWGVDSSGNEGSLNDVWRYNIATNEWTWMGGSKTSNLGPVYGILRTTSTNSTPGGRCEGTDDWMDAENNFWFFGGQGYNGLYNDMWKYSPQTNTWTWMDGDTSANSLGHYGTKGIVSTINLPSSRCNYCRWQDNSGNFYLFGGLNMHYNTTYSDVWKYNTHNNCWTWIAGESFPWSLGSYGLLCADNDQFGPRSRGESRSPVTNKCDQPFLTFGGMGYCYAFPSENDLWMFNPNTLQWRWISGTDSPSNAGNYGIRGVPAASNLPMGRGGACTWLDNAGNLWLFGGLDSAGGHYNDLWKFVPDTGCLPLSVNGGLNISLNKNTICNGDTATLSIVGESIITGYSVYPPGFAAIGGSTYITLFPDRTTTFVITGPSACNTRDTSLVTVYVKSGHQFNYSLTDNSICESASTLLTLVR